LLAQLHAPDLAYHFHGDHLLALLLKYSAEQLNTLVNFESALLRLDGQFSVGVNTSGQQKRALEGFYSWIEGGGRLVLSRLAKTRERIKRWRRSQ
jgi:hypothetical protein